MIRTLKAPTPFKSDLESKPDLFQPTEMKMDPLARNLFGLRSTPPTTAIKNEFERVGIPPYSILKTTGNRDLDNLIIKEAAPEFRAVIGDLIKSDEYNTLSVAGKKKALTDASNAALSAYKEEAQDKFLSKYGQSAIDTLYEKAKSRDVQEDNFFIVHKRKPTSNQDKFDIIAGDYLDIGAIKPVDTQMEKLLPNSR